MKLKEIKILVESEMNEYFDDDRIKSTHDYFDFKNPYKVQDLAKVDKFSVPTAAASTFQDSDKPDARVLFKKYVVPALEKMPDIQKHMYFKMSDTTKVTVTLPQKMRQMTIELYLVFRFPDTNTVEIVCNTITFYNKHKINPHQEMEISSDSDIIGVREVGDFLKFTYKPFYKINQSKYRGRADHPNKMLNFMVSVINVLSSGIQTLEKTQLP